MTLDNQDTVMLLRHAFSKSVCMPNYYKKKILNIYLQYLLRDWSLEKIEKFIIYVKKISTKVIKSTLIQDSSLVVSENNKLPAIEAIGRVDMLFQLNDLAMEKAALSVFKRLMEAMDPMSIKEIVRKKTFSSKVKYEASLYKAYENKYQRLKLYSDKGRLALDFRKRFKSCLKEALLKSGEI